jgi:hypothetical protein
MNEFNFQEGQLVARVFTHWNRTIEYVAKVDRVTRTLAIVGGMKFNRLTGDEYGNRYSKYSIEPATTAVLAEFAEQNRKIARREFLARYLNGNWQSMGEENLDKVATALGFGVIAAVEEK